MAFLPRRSTPWIFSLTMFALLLCIQRAQAGIRHTLIQDDKRSLIVLEQFGFKSTGHLDLEVSDVVWSTEAGDAALPHDYRSSIGFFLATVDDWLQVTRELEQKSIASYFQSRALHVLFTFSDLNATGSISYKHSYVPPRAGKFFLMFGNWVGTVSVSMTVRTSMYNMEGNIKNYLSEGQTQLPLLYFCFFWVYAALAGIWTYVCIKQKIAAHQIHILMGILVVLKAFYMFSEAADKFCMKKTGTPQHGWAAAFHLFNFLRGAMLFVMIGLMGTGWSYLKPYSQGKEKKVLMIVIPLQEVLANIAIAVTGEMGLSGKNWLLWNQIFLLVDVICCCAILFPIVCSIKHLWKAKNLAKLTLFHPYYIVVVSYIYFTRFGVFALGTVMSYHYTWVSELARELATLCFYVFTGYKFCPMPTTLTSY